MGMGHEPHTSDGSDVGRGTAAALATQFAFALAVVGVAAAGYFQPGLFTWRWQGFEPRQAIVPLVQLTMLGMGMTLTLADFRRVALMPQAVAIGIVCQFGIMPLTGFACGQLVGLPPEVATGLVLVGSCPGGVTSNVIAYLARANVALSVTMTACSTVISPLATPAFMSLLADRSVPLDAAGMLLSIVRMILMPVAAGLAVNTLARPLARRCAAVLPAVAMTSICLIIAITVALARDDLAACGPALVAAAVCHNAVGFALGYGTARAARLGVGDARTVAIEVGIQNGGMATGIALDVLKSPAAALPAAVFGPWSALAAALLAAVWSSRPPSPPLPE
jgi:BASS family bile acid:Na+ symporter